MLFVRSAKSALMHYFGIDNVSIFLSVLRFTFSLFHVVGFFYSFIMIKLYLWQLPIMVNLFDNPAIFNTMGFLLILYRTCIFISGFIWNTRSKAFQSDSSSTFVMIWMRVLEIWNILQHLILKIWSLIFM